MAQNRNFSKDNGIVDRKYIEVWTSTEEDKERAKQKAEERKQRESQAS